MSETKRPGSARGPKKKSRAKAPSSTPENPPLESVKDEAEVEVSPPIRVIASEPSQTEHSVTAASESVPLLEEALPPAFLEAEAESQEQIVGTGDEASDSLSLSPRRNASLPPAAGQQSGRKEGRDSGQAGGGSSAKPKPFDEYSTHIYFDKNVKSYIGAVLELPDVRATGTSKEAVLKELESKVEQQVNQIKRRGEIPPEAIFTRRYPDKLEVRLSQSLFRKLDLLSRQEKVGLDQLVAELLSAGVERKAESKSGHGHSHPQHHQQDRRQSHSHQHQHQHQHPQQGNQQQQRHNNRRPGKLNYQDTMNNRENFMEYVRNLEKGNWRKK